MRLFIGSFIDKELVEKIPFEDIEKLFEGNLKPVRKENVHITWVFIGNAEAINELSLREIIDKHINLFKGLIFTSKGLEFWPPKKQPRLIVLSGDLNKKISLVPLIQDLKTICSPDEKEDFLPHITIARFKKDKTIDKKIKLSQIEKFNWQIKEISLIQSVLSSEGPNYIRRKIWIL